MLHVSRHVAHARCTTCFGDWQWALPPIRKRVIYIDQNALSDMMKALNPASRGHGKVDPVWLELYRRLARLVQMQVVVCPVSEYHERESRFAAPMQAALERLSVHLADGIRFKLSQEIEDDQIAECVAAWLDGDETPAADVRPERAVRGDLTDWGELLNISVSSARWPEFTQEERQDRLDRHTEFVDRVIADWQTGPARTFSEVFEHEADAYGETIISEYAKYFSAQRATPPNYEQLLNLSLSPAVRVMNLVCARISESGIPDDQVAQSALTFLRSTALRRVPFNRISALLHAALAMRFAEPRGQRKPPSPGHFTDVNAIAHFLPSCEAMFLDNGMRALLTDNRVAAEVGYQTRIFSKATIDEFFAYLDEVEANVPAVHRAAVVDTYGEAALEPFVSIFGASTFFARAAGSPG